MDVQELSDEVEEVSAFYAERHGIDRTPEWFVLKLGEEVGELTQAFLARSGQARRAVMPSFLGGPSTSETVRRLRRAGGAARTTAWRHGSRRPRTSRGARGRPYDVQRASFAVLFPEAIVWRSVTAWSRVPTL